MNTTPTPAEKALADRDRQWRRYCAAKRQQFAELYADPAWGERLRKFGATLNHFGIEDGDRMVDYVLKSAIWLHQAPPEIGVAALELVGLHVVRIRQKAGLAPFDDPLPGEEDDTFRLCKKALL